MSNKNNLSNIRPGFAFVPFGTDSVAVVTSVHGDQVEYYFEHDKKTKYTLDKKKFGRITHPAGSKLGDKLGQIKAAA